MTLGCESAVHAMQQVFESPETEAIILVDGTNAFTCVHRYPRFLSTPTREDVRLFIDGETLLSQESTTQGDPLAMAMYVIAVNPLMLGSIVIGTIVMLYGMC